MKKGNIMRDVISSNQFTENAIKEYKKGLGDVVQVAITPRTTIELPAHLTQAEIDARVEIYKKLHSIVLVDAKRRIKKSLELLKVQGIFLLPNR